MRALVTGGVGFIGTNLIKRLLSDDHSVTSFDNYSSGFRENEMEGCDYVEADVSKDFSYDVRFDVIFHMAALARIQPSIKYPHKTILNNFYLFNSLLLL